MADCSSVDDGLACQRLSADIIGTTMSATPPDTPEEPDLPLVKRCMTPDAGGNSRRAL